MVAEMESSDSLPGSSNATTDKHVNGPSDQTSQEKTPKKNHKAEREKLKRDQLNDLFLELGSMLDLDRQNSGKASVLGDAARVLRDLVSQVESLRKEHSTLLAERQYSCSNNVDKLYSTEAMDFISGLWKRKSYAINPFLSCSSINMTLLLSVVHLGITFSEIIRGVKLVSSEKNELLEENTTIKARISELQNELRARMGNNSISLCSTGLSHPMESITNQGLATQPMQHQVWSSVPNLSTVAMTNTVPLLHSQQHRPAVADQVHASRPQELQLFPGTSSPPERVCSTLRSTPTSTSSLTDSLPGQLQLSLPQSSQDGSSSSVSHSRRERKNG